MLRIIKTILPYFPFKLGEFIFCWTLAIVDTYFFIVVPRTLFSLILIYIPYFILLCALLPYSWARIREWRYGPGNKYPPHA